MGAADSNRAIGSVEGWVKAGNAAPYLKHAVTNWDPRNNLQKTRAGLNRVRAGQGNMTINLYGHSAIVGVGGGTLSASQGQYIVGAEPYTVGAALARALNRYGVAARRGGWFGMGALAGVAIADFFAFDPRINGAAGWAKPVGGTASNSFGGAMPANTGTLNAAWTFTPTETWDRMVTYFAKFSGGGTFTVDTGGSALTTQSTANATQDIGSVTTSAASDAVQAANLKPTVAGGVYLVGQESYRSAASEVRVRTIGWNGATSTVLSATDLPFSTRNALGFIGGDLTVIECMRNDQNSAIPVATFQANLTGIVTAAQVSGDVILLVDHAPKTWGFTNDAAYIAAIYAVGAAKNLPVVDITKRIDTDGSAANALNYFCPDLVHYNATGWGDIGSWLGQLLACAI